MGSYGCIDFSCVRSIPQATSDLKNVVWNKKETENQNHPAMLLIALNVGPSCRHLMNASLHKTVKNRCPCAETYTIGHLTGCADEMLCTHTVLNSTHAITREKKLSHHGFCFNAFLRAFVASSSLSLCSSSDHFVSCSSWALSEESSLSSSCSSSSL